MKAMLLAGILWPLSTLTTAQIVDGLRFKRFVCPEYPRVAQMAQLEGAILLELDIDKHGVPTEIRVITGHPLLAAAAIKAAWQWRLRPYLLNHEAVAVTMRTQLKFELHGDPRHGCRVEDPHTIRRKSSRRILVE